MLIQTGKRNFNTANWTEIEALCNYEGKDFNLKMIRINNDIREQKYEAAATQIDA